MKVVFATMEFTHVFGITGHHNKKIDTKARKMMREAKEFWIKIVCTDLIVLEMDFVAKTSNGRGMKNSLSRKDRSIAL